MTSFSTSTDTRILIQPTLHTEPTKFYRLWETAAYSFVRNKLLIPGEYYNGLYMIAAAPTWDVLRHNQVIGPALAGAALIRPRPHFPPPGPMPAGPVRMRAWKLVKDAHEAELLAESTLRDALLTSIGESNLDVLR